MKSILGRRRKRYYRDAKNEIGIIWNDKDLKIKWQCKKPIISDKDKNNITFENFKNKFL